MATPELPPCGIYRTTAKIGECDADRLVYFHNHGDPGPGFYFPERWIKNRAVWSKRGMTAPRDFTGAGLKPLPREGFYRVAKTFHCCSKKCVEFQPETFVQLGYNGKGEAILFLPEIAGGALDVPERGTKLDDDVLRHLVPMIIREKGDQRDDLGAFPRVVIH